VTTELLHGPSYERLQEAGFAAAGARASDDVSAVLWLEQNDHRTDHVADAWAADRDPLRLSVSSLGRVVGECHETLAGPGSLLDALTRRRLVDEALRDLEGAVDDAHRHRGDVMDLFGALEGEGHGTPEAVRALVAESDLPERSARFLERAYTRFTEHRERTATAAEFTQSEAFRAVRSAADPFADLADAHDVVVLSGHYDLSATERAVVARLADALPVVVLLPSLDGTDPDGGADAVAGDAARFYRELADETRRVSPDSPAPLARVASDLYAREADTDHDLSAETLRWVEAPTPDREVRQVARSLRQRLATDGVSPGDVLVVVPGLISYREHVEDVFAAHGVEAVTVANKLLYQTYAGDAILALVRLCEGDASAALCARLATNPLVALEGVATADVADLARRLPTDDHERLLAELDERSRAALEALLARAGRVSDAEGVATVEALRSLFDHVGLEASVEEFDDATTDFDAEMEGRALRRVDRVLDAIERTARTLGLDGVLERVGDELDQVRVPPPRTGGDGVVAVLGPRDAFMQSYDHLYLVGFTARDFPPDPDRPRFFESLEAGLDGVETADERATARYQFATMLASAETAYVTTPETTSEDDPLLPSAVLDELARVTGLEPTEHDLGNACREDVQRAVGRTDADRPAADAVEDAIAAGAFDGERATRVRAGVECAQNRATAERTRHDALLDAETVRALHPAGEREPYSPTQVTQYATCGFRYLADRVLDLETPDEYGLEPDPLDVGSLVHGVVEEFYTDLQDTPGERVDLREYDRAELEARLLGAGERARDDLALPYDDAFYDRWLTALFDGLGAPETNDHYDAGDAHETADGLFARFLDAERDREVHPGWFEVGMDLSDDTDAVLDLDLPGGGTVSVAGRLDRVSVDESHDPPTGLVHDYKTSRRSQRTAVDGVSFQLPLYALVAGRRLGADGVATPVDAAFYVLDPPEVSEGWTLRDYAERYGDATDEDYRRLVEEVTPARLDAVTAGVEGGAFQPTVLDESTAGCRHCDYRAVCDVRHHRRRDVAAAMTDDDRPGYVPQYAREGSLLDSFGGDDA
jgi:ATP-dependent helicase/nuclease subunit B